MGVSHTGQHCANETMATILQRISDEGVFSEFEKKEFITYMHITETEIGKCQSGGFRTSLVKVQTLAPGIASYCRNLRVSLVATAELRGVTGEVKDY